MDNQQCDEAPIARRRISKIVLVPQLKWTLSPAHPQSSTNKRKLHHHHPAPIAQNNNGGGDEGC